MLNQNLCGNGGDINLRQFAVDGKPWFCMEAKLSKDRLSPALKYFVVKMKIPYAYQVIKEEGINNIQDNIRIISASTFLTGLS